jgi:class 3 adenylate cyclase
MSPHSLEKSMPDPNLSQIHVVTVTFVLALCGATVLMLLDIWLRRKGVRDPSLIWLAVSLLSWFTVGVLQRYAPQALLNRIGLTSGQIPYFLSPVSSVLFTVTAFRLARVREVFRRDDLRTWPTFAVIAVIGLSVAGQLLLLRGYSLTGRTVDAAASSLALVVLAGGLVYSFYKYGNQLLGGLTIVTFMFLVSNQFIVAAHGQPRGTLAAMSIGGNATLVMLFIALAVAWGLSETSRLRIVGVPSQVTVVVMFFDMRASTKWARDVIKGDYHYAGTFIDQLRTWAWQKASDALPVRPNLVKFLGDGFMFVWETRASEGAIDAQAKAVTELGCTLAREYPVWASGNRALWKDVPDSLGVGVDAGSAIRLTFENGSDDYLGEPVNTAAKLQELARPSGGVVISRELWRRYAGDEVFQAKFPASAEVIVGSAYLPVRATGEVELTGSSAQLDSLRAIVSY